jgi:diaminopimelate decarboxylase
MRVNFDSLNEIRGLAPMAKKRRWQVGLRLNTRSETHAEYPGVRTQFGLAESELSQASRWLKAAGVKVAAIHFHLRTNVGSVVAYRDAMEEALSTCAELGWRPEVLDIGGGFPAQEVEDREGRRLDAAFSWDAMRQGVASVLGRGAGVEEVWMENGRWLAAPAGVLAVTILDAKENRGVRTLICDGGRTLHAMVATWERHKVECVPARRGRRVRTLLCGPTCMAFDNLGEHRLPAGLGPGAVLLWRDAGAYQVCWETRFSHGLAAVAWCGRGGMEVVRPAETFDDWWASR